MLVSKSATSQALSGAVAALWVILSSPGQLCAQQAARAGLASFPADTQQVAYSNFAQLRFSPDYPQICQHVLYQQLRGFQEFLRLAGVDPNEDVDEAILGWRGDTLSGPGSYGLAAGHFQPENVRRFFTQNQLPVRSYAGSNLFPFGSSAHPADIFFTFLDSSLAAFGRQDDVKTILDVREGSAPALDTNQALQAYEAELEGTSPQWGVLTGKAAAKVTAGWLARRNNATTDMTAFFQPVQAVLYRVDWDGGFTAHISVLCNTSESAEGLLRLLNILKSAPVFSAAPRTSGSASLLQSLDTRQEGSRLELNVSGPAKALDEILKVE
jgi:hypothetical protein